MKARLLQLQCFATECSTSLLPSYDVKRAQEILETTGSMLRTREEQLKPKKKFRFKSRDKVRAAALASKERLDGAAAVAAAANAGSSTEQSTYLNGGEADTSYAVTEHTTPGEVLVLSSEVIGQVNGAIRSLIIRGCSGTTIIARCVLGSVRVENCKDCHIYLGPCRTSVYLDDMRQVTMFIASHQLRIHKCHDCKLQVRVNSHPIIEDCSGMGFAPYDVAYAELAQHIQSADLGSAACWSNVVDFRWHRSTQSPNWRILEAKDLPVARVDTSTNAVTGKVCVTTWGTVVSADAAAAVTAIAATAQQTQANSVLQMQSLQITQQELDASQAAAAEANAGGSSAAAVAVAGGEEGDEEEEEEEL